LLVASSSGLVYAAAHSQKGSLLFGIKAKVFPQTVNETPVTTSTDSSANPPSSPTPANLSTGQIPTRSNSITDSPAPSSSTVRIQLTIPNESVTPTPSPTSKINNLPAGEAGQQSAINNTAPTPSPTPQSNGISANVEITLSAPAPSTTPSTSGINVGIGGVNINVEQPKIGILGL